MRKQILLGTKNQAKINIVQAALKSLPVEILTLDNLSIDIDVKEDGQSTEENAAKKARAYFAVSHIPTLAIDGGLHIEQFSEDMQPGARIRRIPGCDRDATDEQVLGYYASELDKVGGKSVGIWKGSITLVTSNEQVFCDSFSFKTILTTERKGGVTSGAPLDAMTLDPATGKYYSEMNWTERPDTRWIFEFLRQHLNEL